MMVLSELPAEKEEGNGGGIEGMCCQSAVPDATPPPPSIIVLYFSYGLPFLHFYFVFSKRSRRKEERSATKLVPGDHCGNKALCTQGRRLALIGHPGTHRRTHLYIYLYIY
ncbi:hypothetical protein, unlikely [Trypanosoma brucei gambiense DAL972]|uniref:Uncharacterized protein n=1 Tax=Trypanosoma brucei gambiense (strain MHOM/CI/86/DAL972) TaxID=679716 RepID=C9ZSR5_TRYB9|nr:hypothetical protein, unlikely [Trypanosoma brucei gambiense DAL972]CBH12449.1 hypothetical protein, unlikely [Trypanosoma brucei gambiense DAL972]|eukprot:XP_011774730.1 hypothetical protein, unlikely [Trypanosoma brucei gambiense DAL972]